MNAKTLAQPDNSADRTINLAISGNRLVSILNALDAECFANGRYRFEGNELVATSSWFADLRETTEAVRDELSRQRCEVRPVVIRTWHSLASAVMYGHAEGWPSLSTFHVYSE